MEDALSKRGERIRKMREQKGFTQEQLAELLNVSVNTISNWECGNTNIRINHVGKLARVLECDEPYLIYGFEQGNGLSVTHGITGESNEKAVTIEDMVISLSQILCISKDAANSLYDACVFSLEDTSSFFEKLDFGRIVELINDYRRYGALEKSSSISNRYLLEKGKNDAKISLLKEIDKVSDLCDSELINRYRCNESYKIIGIALKAADIFELLEQKQRALIVEYLLKEGSDKGSLFNMDKARLIGKYIAARNNKVEDSCTEKLRHYAIKLFDEKVVPIVSDCISSDLIEEYNEVFVEGINITSMSFDVELFQ